MAVSLLRLGAGLHYHSKHGNNYDPKPQQKLSGRC